MFRLVVSGGGKIYAQCKQRTKASLEQEDAYSLGTASQKALRGVPIVAQQKQI